MRRLVLALAIATAAPTFLGGCDKIKDLTGDRKEAKKDKSDDDDDDRKSKKKDKSDKGDERSAKAGGSSAPTTPAAAGTSAAASHVQSDCEVVVTANFAKLLSSPAMTKEVVPLLEEMLATPSPKDAKTKKLQAFMKSSGLSLKSLHNGAVCAKNIGGPGGDHWLFLVGGDIKPDSVVAALESSGVLEPSDKVLEVDGRKALAAKDGALGQYADGVVALSSTMDIFKAGAASSTAVTSVYKVDPGRELAFAMSDAFVQAKVKGDKKAPEPFKTVKSLSGFVDLSANKAEMRLGTGSADEAKKLDGLIALMGGELAKDQKPGSMEATLLASIKSRTDGNDVIVEVPLPPDTLTMAAAMLAAELRKEKSKL